MKHAKTPAPQQARAKKALTRRHAERDIAQATSPEQLNELAAKFKARDMRNTHALKKLAYKLALFASQAEFDAEVRARYAEFDAEVRAVWGVSEEGVIKMTEEANTLLKELGDSGEVD